MLGHQRGDISKFGESNGGPAFGPLEHLSIGSGRHDMPGMDYLLYALCVHHDLRCSWHVFVLCCYAMYIMYRIVLCRAMANCVVCARFSSCVVGPEGLDTAGVPRPPGTMSHMLGTVTTDGQSPQCHPAVLEWFQGASKPFPRYFDVF